MVILEVVINHVLKEVIDKMIERETRILKWIDTHVCFEGRIVCQFLFYFQYVGLSSSINSVLNAH